jgi:hypothetical protein
MGKRMAVTGHMTMTKLRIATPADATRGAVIIQTMRDQLGKYQDYKMAEAAGYLPYMETVPQDTRHRAVIMKDRLRLNCSGRGALTTTVGLGRRRASVEWVPNQGQENQKINRGSSDESIFNPRSLGN